jgi:ligand-binding sensor domain-containing protein
VGAAWAGVWLALLLVFTLAGCGEPNASWQPISTDAGSPIFGIGAQNTPILSLAADPQITSLVYIGTQGAGVRRTVADSNGVQNTDTGMNPHSSVFALTPDPAKRGTLYAGTSSGFYFSTDASATWQARNTGLPADDPITAIAAGPNGSPLLAGTKSHGLFLSADQGNSWRAATGGLPSDGQVNAALWVEGAKTALVAFAGGRLYVSHGDLQEWTQSATGLPAKSEIQALGISGDGHTIYAGTSQGLFSSGDGGQNWASAGGGLPSGSVGALASDAHQPDAYYAAVENNVYSSTDSGKTWRAVASPLDKQTRAVAVATNRSQQPVTYTATGQLYRYPSAGGGSLAPTIAALLVIAVVALLYIRSRRARRGRDRTASPAPKPSSATDTRPPAERYGDADEMEI